MTVVGFSSGLQMIPAVWIVFCRSVFHQLQSRHFFEQHGIVHITTAYWIKVTQSMQPLVPLSCPTRETYTLFGSINRFERIVVGRVLKNDQFEAKRVNIHVSSAKNDFLHHVYQLAGKKAGTHLPERQHPCNPTQLQQIPCLVSTVSFHSRKPNCLEFDFLYLST